MHPRVLRALAALAVATASAGALAAEPDATSRAKEAYDRGVRAHDAGDHEAAARAFAEADLLAPTTASMEAALESAMRADDAVLGAELLDRAASRPVDPGLAKTLDAAKRRFAGRTGKIRVDCSFASRCLASVDGRATDAWHAIIVEIGAHDVVVQRDDERFERLVDVGAGDVVAVSGPARSLNANAKASTTLVPSGHDKAKSSGISPAWFYLGVGLTAVLGGATVLSGVDAVKKHDDFSGEGCAPGASGPVPADCATRADDGKSAATRTNVLLAATGLSAIATAITGAFFVRWAAAPSGAMATIGAKLP